MLITLVSMAIGLAVHLLRPKRYKASVEFFVKNPLYADRNYLYSSDARMIDYFAGDEDIERMKSMIWADSVQDRIVREMRLAEAYDVDMGKPAEAKALKKTFSSRIHLYRTESKVAILSYTDKDEKRAAAVAYRTVELLEQQLRDFYNDMRRSIHATIAGRIQEEDSTINALTDSLAFLREQYGIYDIISPARYNIMLSAMKDNGRPGFARGIELVQNVESLKDQLVSDRAKHLTLAGQYATGTRMNELPITRILRVERPPFKKEGPGLATTLAGCGIAGFFFGLLYVLAACRFRSSAPKTA
jgi:uncharacterized protein involved in exopolysaccharide biosynthesis